MKESGFSKIGKVSWKCDCPRLLGYSFSAFSFVPKKLSNEKSGSSVRRTGGTSIGILQVVCFSLLCTSTTYAMPMGMSHEESLTTPYWGFVYANSFLTDCLQPESHVLKPV